MHGRILRGGDCLVEDAPAALCWWSRLRGLLFRPALAADGGQALLIRPCGSVHTMGMRYALDVVFLDREGRVLAVREHVRPWRFCVGRGAHAVVELHHGAARRLGIALGDRLLWQAG